MSVIIDPKEMDQFLKGVFDKRVEGNLETAATTISGEYQAEATIIPPPPKAGLG